MFNYQGIIDTINGLLNMYSFTMVLFPIVLIVSILVVLSNIVLIKKEGFNVRNVLGIILGLFLCVFTVLPDIMYKALNTSSIIDIHNQNRMDLYIYNFMEAIIHIVVTYIECLLIATSIITNKA